MPFSKLPCIQEIRNAIEVFRVASRHGVHIAAHARPNRSFLRVDYFLPKTAPRDALKQMAAAEAIALAGAGRDIMVCVAQALRPGIPVVSGSDGMVSHIEHHVDPGRDLDDASLPATVLGYAFLALLAANKGAASATLDRHGRLDYWVWRRTGCTAEQTKVIAEACEDLLIVAGARQAVVAILEKALDPDWRTYDWTPRVSVEDEPAAADLETAA